MRLFWRDHLEQTEFESWKVGLFQLAGDAVLTVTHDKVSGKWWVHPPRGPRGNAIRPWADRSPLVETVSRDQMVSVLEREMTRWLNYTGREERQALIDSFEDQYRASGLVAPWLRENTDEKGEGDHECNRH